MAAKLYTKSVSSIVTPDGDTVMLAITFEVVDGGAAVPCIFVQTDDLAEDEVGVYEWGGCVLQLNDDNDDDELSFVAIPKDEYPDDTNAMTFTVTRSTLNTLGAGAEVVDPSP